MSDIKVTYADHVVRAKVQGFRPLTKDQFMAIAVKVLA
jgi:hypothetical protein